MKKFTLLLFLLAMLFAGSTDAQSLTYGNAFDLSKGMNLEKEASILTGSTDPVDVEYSADGSRMYILDSSGEIFQYALSVSFDPSSATLTGSLDVNAVELFSPSSIMFNPDGTSIYFTRSGRVQLYQYSVTTPFDVTSGIASQGIINVVGMDTRPEGMIFNNDGTRLFVVGSINKVVRQYNLTVPYDFSTGVTNSMNTVDVSSQDLSARDVSFNPGGTKMFVLGGVNDAIYQYSLSVPFDLSSTVSYNGVNTSLEIPGGSPVGDGMVFNADGSEISVVIRSGFPNRVNTYRIEQGSFDEIINDGSISGESVINIFEDTFVNAGSTLTLTTHYTIDNLPAGLNPQLEVSTDGFSAELTLSGKATSHQNINDVASLIFTFTDAAFTNSDLIDVQNATAFSSGTGINFRDNDPSVVYGENFNPSVAFYTGKSLDIFSSNTAPTAIAFNADGSRVYVLGDTNDEITQLDLAVPYEISSGASPSGTFGVTDEETSPQDIVFNADGTKMFIVGTSDEVNQYTLANPFDISTGVTFDGSPLDVSSEDSQSIGLAFSPDGLKLYMLGTDSDDINQYSLTNAFDITSGVSFDGKPFSIGTQETNPRSLAFSADGFKFFVVGSGGDDVNQYNLTVPFDITKGVVFEGSPFSLSGQDDAILDLAFDNTGKRMYAMGISTNKIYQYEHTGSSLLESPNDGTVGGSFNIFLVDEVFTNADGTMNPANYSISNLPTGLTPSLAVSADGLSATLTFADKATSHQNANDIASLQFAFGNGAFAGNDASAVSNSTSTDSGLAINFLDNNPQVLYGDGYNLSSALASGTLDLSGEGAVPLEIKFSADGTKLFVLEEDDSEINQYALTTPYDISSGVTFEVNSAVFNSEDTSPVAFSFSNDGLKLFVLGGNSSQMYQYTLSNAFDITSGVSHDGSPLAIAAPDPSGLAFSSDGTGMFISATDPALIYQYTLNTAFDITSEVGSGVPQISVGNNVPEGVSFSADGRSMFIINNDEGSKIVEYLLVAPFDPAIGVSSGKTLSLTGSGFKSPIFSPDGSQLLFLSGNSVNQSSIDLGGFNETVSNTGEVEGELSIRIIDDLFTSAGSSLPFSDYEITNLPIGLSLDISVAADGASATLLFTGSAIDNSNSADLASLQFNFTDAAFTNSTAAEVMNSQFAESNIGVDFIEEPIIEDQTFEIAEHSPDDTTVGIIAATDPEGGNLTFAALTGELGSLFNLNPDGTLIATRGINFEDEGPYEFDVTVTSDAPTNFSSTATITVEVLDVNENPTGIQLSNNTIEESNPIGTSVGALTTTDDDNGQSHTYTLIVGSGDTDNASFSISGTDLVSAEVFDFETKTSYSVRIQTDDGNGGTFEKEFAISIIDLPASVTSLDLANQSVNENEATASLVGAFTTAGEDLSGAYTYTFASGVGDTDNASFSLSGDQLLTAASFDFETMNSYTIRVMTDDGAGNTFEGMFTISVNNVSEAPTDLMLSATSIAENNAVNDVIGMLSTTDVDAGETYTYTLVSGTGDTDNSSFDVSGNEMRAGEEFDFETKSSYSVRVQTDDGNGGTFSKSFSISIIDGNESILVVASIADQDLDEGFGSIDLDLSGVFSDQDGDALTFSVSSSDLTVVTANISGSTLTLSEVGFGSSTVTVTADDGSGITTSDIFIVSVSEVFNTETDITSFSLSEETGSAVIDATTHTVDIEVSRDTDVTNLAPVVSVSQGAMYSPTGGQNFANSTVTYTVTAEDGTTTQDWLVTISVEPNAVPIVANSFPDGFSGEEGFGTTQVTYADVFSDPDGDVLTISVESSDENVVAVELIANDQMQVTEVGIGVSTITVTANDGNGGTVSDTFTFTVTERALGLKEEFTISIYPNPVTNFLTIQSEEQVTVQLVNLEGKEMRQGSGTTMTIDMSSVQPGAYLLLLNKGGEVTQRRIIKRN